MLSSPTVLAVDKVDINAEMLKTNGETNGKRPIPDSTPRNVSRLSGPLTSGPNTSEALAAAMNTDPIKVSDDVVSHPGVQKTEGTMLFKMSTPLCAMKV